MLQEDRTVKEIALEEARGRAYVFHAWNHRVGANMTDIIATTADINEAVNLNDISFTHYDKSTSYPHESRVANLRFSHGFNRIDGFSGDFSKRYIARTAEYRFEPPVLDVIQEHDRLGALLKAMLFHGSHDYLHFFIDVGDVPHDQVELYNQLAHLHNMQSLFDSKPDIHHLFIRLGEAFFESIRPLQGEEVDNSYGMPGDLHAHLATIFMRSFFCVMSPEHADVKAFMAQHCPQAWENVNNASDGYYAQLHRLHKGEQVASFQFHGETYADVADVTREKIKSSRNLQSGANSYDGSLQHLSLEELALSELASLVGEL